MQVGVSLLFVYAMVFLPQSDERGQEGISVAGSSIPGLFDIAEPGPYNEIYKRFVDASGQKVILSMMPRRRAEAKFSFRQADCLFVGGPTASFYDKGGLQAEDLMYSDAVQTVALKVYGPIGSDPIESLASLNGIHIAMDVGAGEKSFIKRTFDFDDKRVLMLGSLKKGFRLLDNGRVSALIAMDLDVNILRKQEPRYGNYSVSSSFELLHDTDVLVCRVFPKTVRFIASVNKTLKKMRQSGQLEDILFNWDRYSASWR